ncbi:hypothetical protein BAY59_05805 [Prauserella coralliicola]|nr:hypothetical protein BAY59_05805 [Prauserella coralliicola]
MTKTANDTWFLLVQYRREGRTEVTEFEDLTRAASAYSETERQYKDELTGSDPVMDVLLVGAESLDVVQERYPSYFIKAKSRSARLSRLLRALPPVPVH